MSRTLASVTLDSPSNSSSLEFNPWASGSHSAYAATPNAAETGVTYTSANGRFTVAADGLYRLWGKCFIENQSGSFPANVILRIKINGATVWDTTVGVHSAADPWMFPWGLARPLTAGDFVEYTLQELATDNVRTTEGSTFNIARVG